MSETTDYEYVSEELALNYHLMHPGSNSEPGDCNAALYMAGVYHMHYILRHPWKGNPRGFSFVHVTSPEMLHWTWQKTKLQPSFTGHGMFSGTAFVTKEGRAAAIYHGQASGRNHIAIARDGRLSAWEKPYPVEPRLSDGSEPEMRHWDPDCFLIGDTYYSISGGVDVPVLKSDDLVNWTYVGDFLKYDLPDVARGEDISCANFFPIDGRWMLLCISHQFGCRYYIGDWDAEAEQFVPETHGRMNWRRAEQSILRGYTDFFAPESLLTRDGRRVMWAWLAGIPDPLNAKTIQSLPRELSIAPDGSLRIRPLRELESLRYDQVILSDIAVKRFARKDELNETEKIAELDGDAWEIRVTVDRSEASRKRFGFRFFADAAHEGFPVIIRPETSTIVVGTKEAPFAVSDLAADEDLELRIFIDKYLVEVFSNDRQAVVATHGKYKDASGIYSSSLEASTTIRSIEMWKLRPTNAGFFEAQKNPIWEPDTE